MKKKTDKLKTPIVLPTAEQRVMVTKTFCGICHMQVCAVADATDEEILEVCNRENPSGTSNGWSGVVRDNENMKPGPCADVAGRIHYMIVC